MPSRYIFYNDTLHKSLPFNWYFYLIQYQDKRILIDTGADRSPLIQAFAIKDYQHPVDLLKKQHIDPESITDIIITHAHFDHAGTIDYFPNATIYIQKQELKILQNNNFSPKIQSFIKGSANVIGFDEQITLYNLFKVRKIGGHSPGSSVVSFQCQGKNCFFTGDEAYFLENIWSLNPVGSYFDRKKNLDFLKYLEKSKGLIWTHHDPAQVFQKERGQPLKMSLSYPALTY